MLTIVDTGVWIHTLRRNGDPAIRQRLKALLFADRAAWCDVVRVELWHGATKEYDKDLLRVLDRTIPRVPMNKKVWNRAVANVQVARAVGLQLPIADHLIFACAQAHGFGLEHADKHFAQLEVALGA